MATVQNDLNRIAAMVLGWVLVAVGFLGFAWDPLLGLFEVDVLHNVVHVASGAFLLAGAYVAGGARARLFNMILGGVYLLVAVVGFAAPGVVAVLMEANGADHWLHVALGIALLGVAFAQRSTTVRPQTGTAR